METGKHSDQRKSIFAAVFYVLVSMSTTFFNKAVLSVYSFHFTNIMLLCQHLFTVGVLLLLRAIGTFDFPNPERDKCIQLLPTSLLYSINVGMSLTALTNLNIPMYGVLKRLATLFALIGESYFLNKHSSWKLKQSVGVILAGAIVAGFGDLTFDMAAYILATVSCISQAAYLICVAKSGLETGINSFGLLFYNSMLALPFVAAMILLTGELNEIQYYERASDTGFQIIFLINLALGSLLNYSLFLCTTVNSALTTTIMGHLKSALNTILGLFLFGGVVLTPLNTVGLILNSGGGIWYSYIKYEEGKKKDRNKDNSKMQGV